MYRNVKTIIYIFCEWTTEENYFKKIKQIFRVPIKINIVDLKGWTKIKDNPEWVKRKILKTLKRDNPKIWWLEPKVFIIFDLDIFENWWQLDNTINFLKEFNVIVNNEIFEYWILSHFETYDLWSWKSIYFSKIKFYLEKLGFKLKSNKFTWSTDYNWLNKNYIKIAVDNVKEVNEKSNWNLKSRDPYSNMYKIIKYLETNK